MYYDYKAGKMTILDDTLLYFFLVQSLTGRGSSVRGEVTWDASDTEIVRHMLS